MKRTYINPELHVEILTSEAMLLEGSTQLTTDKDEQNIRFTEEEVDGFGVKSFNDYVFWDD